MRKFLIALLCLFLLVGLSSWASAIPFTGSITSGDGLTAGDGPASPWATGATLSWEVDFDGTSWIYDYTFTVASKGISHVIFEVSDNFTESNIYEGTTVGWQFPKDMYTADAQGGSNPGIPDPLYGLKWDTPDGDWLTYSWTIVTDRAPMWGDFYSKDGTYKVGQGRDAITYDVYAYNSAFGDPDVAFDFTTLVAGKVLVPDTETTPVPEPATMLLLGFGLIGLAGFGRSKLFNRA